jgi:hypothetical protein
MVPMLALSSPVDLPPDRPWRGERLRFVNHDLPLFSSRSGSPPSAVKKNLGRETLSPALFYVLRRAGSPR